MLDLINRTSWDFNVDLLHNVSRYICCRPVEVLVVGSEEMRTLNFMHRKRNYPTDVLSFPLADFGLEPGVSSNIPLGSVVICFDVAQEAALRYGHTLEQEFALLFIHGILHLMGYDHEVDGGEHREEEENLVAHFGLPKSLIVRNEI